MRVIVLSDTHIPSTCKKIPDELIEQFKGADLIIHAGDLTEISVLDELKAVAQTEAVVGNMDSYKIRKTLSEKKILELGGYRIGLIHGSGPPDKIIAYLKDKFKDEKLDCIIYGHTHSPSIETIDNTVFFNPGSPTDRIFAPYKAYGILEIDKKGLRPKIVRL